VQTSKEVEI
jgi:dynein heavy chain, axonemal